MNIKNLDKLATYLEALPEDYEHFDMTHYFNIGAIEDAELLYIPAVNPPCGTAACALGHGPAAGIKPRKSDYGFYNDEYYPEDKYLDWASYCDKFIDIGTMRGQEQFDWIFSGAWTQIDNSHWGAAARIRYMLAGNEITGKSSEFESYLPKYQEFVK